MNEGKKSVGGSDRTGGAKPGRRNKKSTRIIRKRKGWRDRMKLSGQENVSDEHEVKPGRSVESQASDLRDLDEKRSSEYKNSMSRVWAR